MWNERYAGDDYFYGTEPNTFLAENAKLLTGPVLSLCEGEGRNAVFLASLGLDVLGVDSSDVGLAKAQKLAAEKKVSIRTEAGSISGCNHGNTDLITRPCRQALGSVASGNGNRRHEQQEILSVREVSTLQRL